MVFTWSFQLNIQGLQTEYPRVTNWPTNTSLFWYPTELSYLSQWNSVVSEYWHCEKDEVRCDLYSSTIVYILRTWRFVFSLISFLKINYVGESRINWPDILGSIYFCDLFIEQSVLEKNIKITLSHILGYGQRVLNVALFKKGNLPSQFVNSYFVSVKILKYLKCVKIYKISLQATTTTTTQQQQHMIDTIVVLHGAGVTLFDLFKNMVTLSHW